MKIDLLYFDGCPSWQEALVNLRAVLGESASVRLIRIDSFEQAAAEQFAGSPTIRVNGKDAFPIEHPVYGLACRVYETPGGRSGVPTIEMIQAALMRRERIIAK